ncbi:MAG: ISAzo13-like element transposase-related protein [Burkholderiaceae bacterium]
MALKEKRYAVSRPAVLKLLRVRKYTSTIPARRTEVRVAFANGLQQQFDHINEQREDLRASGEPIIRVDTKRRANWRFQKCTDSLTQST